MPAYSQGRLKTYFRRPFLPPSYTKGGGQLSGSRERKTERFRYRPCVMLCEQALCP
ncbi:hypothetical protein [Neisseria sicca]|uniref:hypothetical protein n=1 Tax=Neisseria sicca TaxID=490 RepID=UPI001957A4D4|nr:hypothetical protein [Neisseria sicca]